jgi:hypothetical protein
MKKMEMEEHKDAYHDLVAQARSAERTGLYRMAMQLALSSWEHVDGMMQYERKYEDTEFETIPAIEMVLKYAPLLFDFESLDALDALLKDCRRIERNTSESLTDRLSAARARMWENHRLWDYIETNPNCKQNELRKGLGGEQEQWRSVVEDWHRMGLLRRSPDGGSYTLTLATQMGELVMAKCPACGHAAEGTKAVFLDQLPCPKCGASAFFLILTTEGPDNSKE